MIAWLSHLSMGSVCPYRLVSEVYPEGQRRRRLDRLVGARERSFEHSCSMVMPRQGAADVTEAAGKVEAGAGVQLADVAAVKLLPGRCAGQRRLEAAGVTPDPFCCGHQRIGNRRSQVVLRVRKSTPAWRAMASKWGGQFVLSPIAVFITLQCPALGVEAASRSMNGCSSSSPAPRRRRASQMIVPAPAGWPSR